MNVVKNYNIKGFKSIRASKSKAIFTKLYQRVIAAILLSGQLVISCGHPNVNYDIKIPKAIVENQNKLLNKEPLFTRDKKYRVKIYKPLNSVIKNEYLAMVFSNDKKNKFSEIVKIINTSKKSLEDLGANELNEIMYLYKSNSGENILYVGEKIESDKSLGILLRKNQNEKLIKEDNIDFDFHFLELITCISQHKYENIPGILNNSISEITTIYDAFMNPHFSKKINPNSFEYNKNLVTLWKKTFKNIHYNKFLEKLSKKKDKVLEIIESNDNLKEKCLFTSIKYNKFDSFINLLKRGANPNILENGKTIYHYILDTQQSISENKYFKKKDNTLKYLEYIHKNRFNLLEMPNFDIKDKQNKSILDYVFEYDNVEIFKFLLKIGLYINEEIQLNPEKLINNKTFKLFMDFTKLVTFITEKDLKTIDKAKSLCERFFDSNIHIENFLLVRGDIDLSIYDLVCTESNLFYAKIAKFFYDKGSPINEKQSIISKKTPLEWIINDGNVNHLKIIFGENYEKIKIYNTSETPLLIQAFENFDMLKFLIEKAKLEIDKKGIDSPLFKAISQNKIEVIKYLLNQGADEKAISYVKSSGEFLNILSWACYVTDSNSEIVELILKKCDIKIFEKNYNEKKYSRFDTPKYISKFYCDKDFYKNSLLKSVKKHDENGEDRDEKEIEEEITKIKEKADKEFIESTKISKLLIEYGGKYQNQTINIFNLSYQNEDIDLLKSFYKRKSLPIETSRLLIQSVAENKSLNFIQFLLSQNHHPFEVDHNSNTPFHLAIKNENFDLVKLLIAKYKNFDSKRRTPSINFNINKENDFGETLYCLALKRGNNKILELIEKEFSSINEKIKFLKKFYQEKDLKSLGLLFKYFNDGYKGGNDLLMENQPIFENCISNKDYPTLLSFVEFIPKNNQLQRIEEFILADALNFDLDLAQKLLKKYKYKITDSVFIKCIRSENVDSLLLLFEEVVKNFDEDKNYLKQFNFEDILISAINPCKGSNPFGYTEYSKYSLLANNLYFFLKLLSINHMLKINKYDIEKIVVKHIFDLDYKIFEKLINTGTISPFCQDVYGRNLFERFGVDIKYIKHIKTLMKVVSLDNLDKRFGDKIRANTLSYKETMLFNYILPLIKQKYPIRVIEVFSGYLLKDFQNKRSKYISEIFQNSMQKFEDDFKKIYEYALNNKNYIILSNLIKFISDTKDYDKHKKIETVEKKIKSNFENFIAINFNKSFLDKDLQHFTILLQNIRYKQMFKDHPLSLINFMEYFCDSFNNDELFDFVEVFSLFHRAALLYDCKNQKQLKKHFQNLNFKLKYNDLKPNIIKINAANKEKYIIDVLFEKNLIDEVFEMISMGAKKYTLKTIQEIIKSNKNFKLLYTLIDLNPSIIRANIKNLSSTASKYNNHKFLKVCFSNLDDPIFELTPLIVNNIKNRDIEFVKAFFKKNTNYNFLDNIDEKLNDSDKIFLIKNIFLPYFQEHKIMTVLKFNKYIQEGKISMLTGYMISYFYEKRDRIFDDKIQNLIGDIFILLEKFNINNRHQNKIIKTVYKQIEVYSRLNKKNTLYKKIKNFVLTNNSNKTSKALNIMISFNLGINDNEISSKIIKNVLDKIEIDDYLYKKNLYLSSKELFYFLYNFDVFSIKESLKAKDLDQTIQYLTKYFLTQNVTIKKQNKIRESIEKLKKKMMDNRLIYKVINRYIKYINLGFISKEELIKTINNLSILPKKILHDNIKFSSPKEILDQSKKEVELLYLRRWNEIYSSEAKFDEKEINEINEIFKKLDLESDSIRHILQQNKTEIIHKKDGTTEVFTQKKDLLYFINLLQKEKVSKNIIEQILKQKNKDIIFSDLISWIKHLQEKLINPILKNKFKNNAEHPFFKFCKKVAINKNLISELKTLLKSSRIGDNPKHLEILKNIFEDLDEYFMSSESSKKILQSLHNIDINHWIRIAHEKIIDESFDKSKVLSSDEVINEVYHKYPNIEKLITKEKITKIYNSISNFYDQEILNNDQDEKYQDQSRFKFSKEEMLNFFKYGLSEKYYKSLEYRGDILTAKTAGKIAAIRWAVESSSGYSPRIPQMLSFILSILSPSGILLQINTGEGKTLTASMIAAYQASLGKDYKEENKLKKQLKETSRKGSSCTFFDWNNPSKISSICYFKNRVLILTPSENLANSGCQERKKFFELLDLSCSSVCNSERYYSDVVYSNPINVIGTILRDKIDEKHFRYLIADEVDSLFYDNICGSVELSSMKPGIDQLRSFIVNIFEVVSMIKSRMVTFNQNEVYYCKEDFCLKESEGVVIIDDKKYSKEDLPNYPQIFTNTGTEDKLKKFIVDRVKDILLANIGSASDYEKYDYNSYIELQKNIIETLQKIDEKNIDNQEKQKKKLAYMVRKNRELKNHSWRKSKRTRIISLPSYWRNLCTGDQLENWIVAACKIQAKRKNIDFIISNETIMPVDVMGTGEVQYNTVYSDCQAQFLQLMQKKFLTPYGLTCTFMPYIKFFQNFDGKITGMTGTLGNDALIEYLKKTYKIKYVAKIAPFKKSKQKNIEAPKYLAKSLMTIQVPQEKFLNRLCQNVVKRLKNRRGILMLIESIAEVETIHKYLNKKYNIDISELFTYNGAEDISEYKTKMFNPDKDILLPGQIILATNLAGRGTDINASRLQEEGGLHIIVTFLPSNSRVELQNIGRTSRKGERGTCQFIVKENKEKLLFHELQKQRDQENDNAIKYQDQETQKLLNKYKFFDKTYHITRSKYGNSTEDDKDIYKEDVLERLGLWRANNEKLIKNDYDQACRSFDRLDTSQSIKNPFRNNYRARRYLRNSYISDYSWDLKTRMKHNFGNGWEKFCNFFKGKTGEETSVERFRRKTNEAFQKARNAYNNYDEGTIFKCYYEAYLYLKQYGNVQFDIKVGKRKLETCLKEIQVYEDRLKELTNQLTTYTDKSTKLGNIPKNSYTLLSPLRQTVEHGIKQCEEALYPDDEKNIVVELVDIEKVLRDNYYICSRERDEYVQNGLVGYIQVTAQKKVKWWQVILSLIINACQFLLGALLAVFTVGALANIGISLMTDAVMDSIQVLISAINGTFDFKQWGKNKAKSLAFSVAFGLATGGALSKAANISNSFGGVMKSFGIRLGLQTTMQLTGYGIQKLVQYSNGANKGGKKEAEIRKMILRRLKSNIYVARALALDAYEGGNRWFNTIIGIVCKNISAKQEEEENGRTAAQVMGNMLDIGTAGYGSSVISVIKGVINISKCVEETKNQLDNLDKVLLTDYAEEINETKETIEQKQEEERISVRFLSGNHRKSKIKITGDIDDIGTISPNKAIQPLFKRESGAIYNSTQFMGTSKLETTFSKEGSIENLTDELTSILLGRHQELIAETTGDFVNPALSQASRHTLNAIEKSMQKKKQEDIPDENQKIEEEPQPKKEAKKENKAKVKIEKQKEKKVENSKIDDNYNINDEQDNSQVNNYKKQIRESRKHTQEIEYIDLDKLPEMSVEEMMKEKLDYTNVSSIEEMMMHAIPGDGNNNNNNNNNSISSTIETAKKVGRVGYHIAKGAISETVDGVVGVVELGKGAVKLANYIIKNPQKTGKQIASYYENTKKFVQTTDTKTSIKLVKHLASQTRQNVNKLVNEFKNADITKKAEILGRSLTYAVPTKALASGTLKLISKNQVIVKGVKAAKTGAAFIKQKGVVKVTLATPIVGKVGKRASKVGKVSSKGGKIPRKLKIVHEEAKKFLGKDYKKVTNKSGDNIFMSKDGLRKMRFDIKNPHGDAPHVHLEIFKDGKWRDAIKGNHRLYPKPE